MKKLGIILVVLGIIMIAVNNFKFVTHKKVVDLGPVQIDADKNHSIEWSPVAGGVLLVAGVVLLIMKKK